MKRKIIKEIDNESVVGFNFGVRKEILVKVAKASEIIRFKDLASQKSKLKSDSRPSGRWQDW